MNRILVIDDEPDTLDLYRIQLAREDRSVTAIDCPKKALEILAEQEFDVVITDIMMPDVDGFSLIREATTAPGAPPFIAVTGYGSDATLHNALETDCFGYLNKPFDWNYLNLLVDKACKVSARLRRQSRWQRNTGHDPLSNIAGGGTE